MRHGGKSAPPSPRPRRNNDMTKETTWLDKLNRAGELALTASYKTSDMAGDLWRVGLEPVARRADALYGVLPPPRARPWPSRSTVQASHRKRY